MEIIHRLIPLSVQMAFNGTLPIMLLPTNTMQVEPGKSRHVIWVLGKVFPISKKLNKSTTVEHIPSSNHLLKRKLESQFAKFNTKLRIKKHSAIIDYLAKQATILTRACVRENVQSGWIASGMIDSHGHCMPVLHKRHLIVVCLCFTIITS